MLSFDVPGGGAGCLLPAAAIAVGGIAGVPVVVAVATPGVIVGPMEDIAAVEVEAAPMVSPLIRPVP